jgi:hypothetical protein
VSTKSLAGDAGTTTLVLLAAFVTTLYLTISYGPEIVDLPKLVRHYYSVPPRPVLLSRATSLTGRSKDSAITRRSSTRSLVETFIDEPKLD